MNAAGGMRRRLMGGLLALALSAPGWAQAPAGEPPLVRWYAADFPPAFILRGELRGQGYYDRFHARHIVPALNGFRHKQLVASPARILHDLVTQPEACALGLSKTPERERRYLFSRPILLYLPLGLAVRRAELDSLRPFLDGRGRVRLDALLANTSHKLGLAKSRALGSLERVVGRHEASTVPITSLSTSPTLLRMLALRRGIDAALTYSFELTLLNDRGPGGRPMREHLAWLPVSEQSGLQWGYAACARSPAGARVIAALDGLLAREDARQAMQAYYEEWLDAEGRRWFLEEKALAARAEAARGARPSRP